MLSLTEFINALKNGQLIYVQISFRFLFAILIFSFMMERFDFIYEKLSDKGFDMINVARLIFTAVGCVIISLLNVFIINRTVAIIGSVVEAILTFILIKNARDLPIWEEEE